MTPEDRTEFGRRLREARRSRGWTQADLAAKLDIGLRTVQGIEGGQQAPQRGTMSKIRRTLGVDATPEETRASWDRPTQVVLDIIGAALDAMDPRDRQALVLDLTRFVFEQRMHYEFKRSQTPEE